MTLKVESRQNFLESLSIKITSQYFSGGWGLKMPAEDDFHDRFSKCFTEAFYKTRVKPYLAAFIYVFSTADWETSNRLLMPATANYLPQALISPWSFQNARSSTLVAGTSPSHHHYSLSVPCNLTGDLTELNMFKQFLRPSMPFEGIYLRPKGRNAAPAPGLFPSRRWVRYAMPLDLRKEPGTSLMPKHLCQSDPLYRH